MTNECIICLRKDQPETVEHIIPRSLGNLHYVLPKGVVCKRCNSRFSHIENRILSSPEFVKERRRLRRLRREEQEPTSELDANDIAVFIGKIVFEGLYQSRRSIWTQLPEEVRQVLAGQRSPESLETKSLPAANYKPIPKWIERWRLGNNDIKLKYHLSKGELYGRFEFGRIVLTVRVV